MNAKLMKKIRKYAHKYNRNADGMKKQYKMMPEDGKLALRKHLQRFI